MRILHLINRIPYPPKDGGAILYYNFILAANKLGCEVTQLCMNTSRHYTNTSQLPTTYTELADMHFVEVNNDIRILDAFINLFSSKSYHIQRFESKAYTTKLIELLKNKSFDIIQVDSLFVSSYIPVIKKYSKAKIVLRAHNVEHLIWERMAKAEKNPLKKAYLFLLAKRLKKFELAIINQVDALLPITDIDKALFKQLGCRSLQHTVPAGIDTKKFITKQTRPSQLSLFHLGSMDWIPNQQGIQWFIQKIWPLITEKHPAIKFYIAGRNTPEWLLKLNIPNIKVIGEVNSAKEFINKHSLMMVPLLSGSGMRIKILEGMALGKTIISTTIGAEGIDIENGKHLLIANSPQEFLAQIEFCLTHPEAMQEIGRQAKALVVKKYDNQQIIEQLILFYQKLIS